MTYGPIKSIEIGPEIGSQLDPYREKIQLCEYCGNCLRQGEMARFHGRYGNQVTVKRDELERRPK